MKHWLVSCIHVSSGDEHNNGRHTMASQDGGMTPHGDTRAPHGTVGKASPHSTVAWSDAVLIGTVILGACAAATDAVVSLTPLSYCCGTARTRGRPHKHTQWQRTPREGNKNTHTKLNLVAKAGAAPRNPSFCHLVLQVFSTPPVPSSGCMTTFESWAFAYRIPLNFLTSLASPPQHLSLDVHTATARAVAHYGRLSARFRRATWPPRATSHA
jgi:hypothetical protein